MHILSGGLLLEVYPKFSEYMHKDMVFAIDRSNRNLFESQKCFWQISLNFRGCFLRIRYLHFCGFLG